MSPKIYAVEYIGAQDAARINAFSKDDQGNYFEHRNTGRALPYTKNISGRLTDHTGIDYSRTATEAERETIYKAMMGTVIVHGSSFEAFYQRSNALGHAGYDSHFNALEVIDESINILWKSVKRGTYFGRLDQVTRDESRQSLLTKHFVKWFYEALESYCHDLNFFGGTASFDWFQQTCSSFSERRTSEYDLEIEYSSRRKGIKHIHIHDTKGFKIAVLKPKPVDDETRRNDWIVSLGAKAIGLIDVINPAIPVKIEANNLIIDRNDFTRILEPFVGVDGDKKATVSAEIRRLLDNALKEDERQKAKASYTFTLHTFAKYFENSNLPAFQRWEDLQTFNRSVDIENLLKLIAFWQIFRVRDMHSGNILWQINPRGRLSIVGIDYNLCFDNPMDQQPPLSMVQQATQPILASARSFIPAISFNHLCQVFREHRYEIPRCLTDRLLENTKRILREQPTIRHIMHAFYKLQETTPMAKTKRRSDFYEEVDPRLTVYDPLEIRPVGEEHPENLTHYPEEPDLPGYKSVKVEGIYGQAPYISYQARYLHDWVFSAKSSEDLQEERFFKTSVFPGERMWREGMLLYNQFFTDSYLKMLPAA